MELLTGTWIKHCFCGHFMYKLTLTPPGHLGLCTPRGTRSFWSSPGRLWSVCVLDPSFFYTCVVWPSCWWCRAKPHFINSSWCTDTHTHYWFAICCSMLHSCTTCQYVWEAFPMTVIIPLGDFFLDGTLSLSFSKRGETIEVSRSSHLGNVLKPDLKLC